MIYRQKASKPGSGPRHRLRKPEVFDKPEGILQPRQVAQGHCRGSPPHPARDSEKIFGLIPRFKSRDELLEEEFSKFVADAKPEEAADIRL